MLSQKIYVHTMSVTLCPPYFERKLADYIVEPSIRKLSEILLIPRTCHGSGNSSRICLVNPLDRVAKLQEGFVKGATVELERYFLGEGSLFPNCLDLGEPLWVLRPQIVDFENRDSGS